MENEKIFKVYGSRIGSEKYAFVYTLRPSNYEIFGGGQTFGGVSYEELLRLADLAQKNGYRVVPVEADDGSDFLHLSKADVTKIKKALDL